MRFWVQIFAALWLLLLAAPISAEEIRVSPQQVWQDTGITITRGTEYSLTSSGIWSFGGICGVADPTGKGNSGLCELGVKFVTGYSGAALVGRIGNDGKPFFIGTSLTFTAREAGRLYVGPNVFDPLAGDNTGELLLTVNDHYVPAASEKITELPAKAAVPEGPRIALVVGNGAYSDIPLSNPVPDAALITQSLRKLGFDVEMVTDAGQKDMKRAINRFGDRLETAGDTAVGFFFYAGHGVQVGGQNYLIPVDAHIQHEKDVDVEAVSANAVLAGMEYAGNGVNIIVLDACRNNPYKRSFRSVDRGLARMDAPRGSLIAYSTAPGRVAADGDGNNSPYSRALASAMLQQDVAIEQMFRRVRNQVMQDTKDLQIPWEASSLTGEDFFFNPRN